jgi:hypothetical protein
MSRSSLRTVALCLLLAGLLPLVAQAQAPEPQGVAPQATSVTNEFTYQGQLKANGVPVNGFCDFVFTVWDAASGGTQPDPAPAPQQNVQVTNGVFTIPNLYFAEWTFDGSARWLEISVKCPTGIPGASYTTLAPRQPLTATPYALSLRPGAHVLGSVSMYYRAVFSAHNSSTASETWGVQASSASPAGAGIRGTGVDGAAGGRFTSSGGRALYTQDATSLIYGPNPKQLGMLRWYEANRANYAVTVGDFPDQMIFDGDNIWVTSWGAGQVTQIRPSDEEVLRTCPAGTNPNALTYDGRALYVASESVPDITIVNPRTCENRATLGTAQGIPNSGHWGMAFDGEHVWVTNSGANSVTKIRAGDKNVVGTYPTGQTPQGVIYDGMYIWVANNGDNTVTKLYASDGSNAGTYPVGAGPVGLVYDGAHVWVANSGGSSVTRLTRDGAVDGTSTVAPGPFFLAFDGYNIWVTHYSNPGKVSRFRAEDGGSPREYTIGRYPFGVVFDGANVWVSISYDHYVTKF